MIAFKTEFHKHSTHPYWYKAYGDYNDWTESFEHPLRQNIFKIYDWLNEHRISWRETVDGACWKFKNPADMTMFILKWQ